jgi:hypothetical protein
MNSGVATQAPVDAGEHPSARVGVGDRQDTAGGAHNAVVLDVGVLVAVPEELYRGDHEQETEDREHEVEGRNEDGAKGDEDRAHDERDQDSEGQDPLLVFGGDRERRHDHDEYEEVVDGQALFDM